MRQLRALLFFLACPIGCGGDAPPPPPPPNLGSAVVSWSLVDGENGPTTCGDLGLSGFQVRLGAGAIDVQCGEEQTLRFDRLLPSTYGVTISLLVAGRDSGLFHQSNVVVEAQKETLHEVTIDVNQNAITKGSIRFEWNVEGGSPDQRCALIGGETVRFATTESAIAQFTKEERCTDGLAIISDLEPGVYEVEAELLDIAGSRVTPLKRFDVLVESGEEAERTLSFEIPGDSFGDFHGAWTITGSTAAEACDPVSGDDVVISLRTLPTMMQGIEVGSATASCDAGEVLIPDLRAGLSRQVRATFTLNSELLGTLAVETSGPFFIEPDKTSSVAVDFQVAR